MAEVKEAFFVAVSAGLGFSWAARRAPTGPHHAAIFLHHLGVLVQAPTTTKCRDFVRSLVLSMLLAGGTVAFFPMVRFSTLLIDGWLAA